MQNHEAAHIPHVTPRQRNLAERGFYVICGMLLYALALDLFLAGNDIAAGGVTGIATVLTTILPFSIGTIALVLNIPVLIASLFIKGWKYSLGTIGCAVLYSLFIDLFSFLPTLTNDPLAAAFFGGVMYGFGMTCVTLARASVGGTDLLIRLLVLKFPNMPVGRMSLVVDGAVVVLAMIVYGHIEVGLYAVLTIVVCSIIADRLVISMDMSSVCMIITSIAPHELADPLMEKYNIAVTHIHGVGMYHNKDRNILLAAVNPKDMYSLKHYLTEMDPYAFLIVLSATEVVGGRVRPRFHRP